MILYAAVCGLWLPLNFWMMPWHAMQVGQVRAQLPGRHWRDECLAL